MIGSLRLTLRYDSSELGRITPLIERFIAEHRVSEAAGYAVHLLVEEIVSNRVRHARPIGDDGRIDLHLDDGPSGLTILVEDDGPPFDPTKVPDRGAPDTIEQWQAGGLGLRLVRGFARSWSYRRENGRNRLEVIVAKQASSHLRAKRRRWYRMAP